MTARRVVVPLVVLAIAAALWLWKPGDAPVVELSSDVAECATKLREIHLALLEHSRKHGGPPAESGARFLEALLAGGEWPDTPESRARLCCPGNGRPYAARDQAGHPLARFPSGGAANEPIAACDGGDVLAHGDCMNVLYSDGSVVTLVLEQEIASGNLPAGTTAIPVGPASPLAELRELTAE